MCALREETRITPAIRQFDGLEIDEIVVACSETSWRGGVKGDRTAEIALRQGATVRLFDWREEADQKNWIVRKMLDFDWILMFAPDMYMTSGDLYKVIKFLRSDLSNDRAYGCKMLNYWKDYNTITKPDRNFNTLAIRPTERFEHSATIYNWVDFPLIKEVTMHHLSWVKDDRSVLTKIKTYSDSDSIVKNWYEEKWLGWSKGMRDIDPTLPEASSYTVKHKLPQDLVEHLTKYKFNQNYEMGV